MDFDWFVCVFFVVVFQKNEHLGYEYFMNIFLGVRMGGHHCTGLFIACVISVVNCILRVFKVKVHIQNGNIFSGMLKCQVFIWCA